MLCLCETTRRRASLEPHRDQTEQEHDEQHARINDVALYPRTWFALQVFTHNLHLTLNIRKTLLYDCTDNDSGNLLKPRKLRFERQAGTSSSNLKSDVRSIKVVNAISASVYARAAPMQKCVP